MEESVVNNKKLLDAPKVNLWVVAFLFAVIAVSPFVDLWVSNLFFANGDFFLKDNMLFMILHKGIPELLVFSAFMVFVLWFVGCRRDKNWIWGIDTKIMAFVSGSMFLAPLLIVNGVFKSFWGRARPFDIVEFGGDKLFTPPMIISNQCNLDCSFMSGHTSVGFWVLCLAFLAPQHYRKKAIIGVVLFGVLVAFARVAQGNHFLSDVLFSAVVTSSVVIWLHYKIFPEEYKNY